MDGFWRTFFSEYGPAEVASDDDLFKQVAHTVNGQRIPNELFVWMLERITTRLQLCGQDHLLDCCCGNGLFTYELAARVDRVTGVDFVPRNIRTAQSRKSRPNTSYVIGDVTAPLADLVGRGCFPNKCLMHGSLAYFTAEEFATILKHVMEHLGDRRFDFLFTGVPNAALKWKFYDTPERRARHEENEKRSSGTNDGLGRWWQPEEIRQVCDQLGLRVIVEDQPLMLSNYRMDALVSSPA